MQYSKRSKKLVACAVLFISVLALAGCAEVPKDPDDRAEYEHNHDPAEPTNRKIFSVNKYLDDHVLKPVARAYRDDLPVPVQQSLHNFADNLHQPQIALNDVLQGNFKRAGDSTERFLINTAFGVAGLFDVASGGGLPGHQADFGQTFGVWGIGSGPFVELPILGASSVRDTAGTAVSIVADPFGSVLGQPALLSDIGYAGTTVGIVDGRSEVLTTTDRLEKNSLDYYATLRSIYQQRRENLVAEGKNPDAQSSKQTPNAIAPMVIQ